MLYFLPSLICYFNSCLNIFNSVLYKGQRRSHPIIPFFFNCVTNLVVLLKLLKKDPKS